MRTKHTQKRLKAMEADLERFAKEDGVQRGIMYDHAGNMRCERVSATALHNWIFKTTAGKPFQWGDEKLNDCN